jgi:hypothetical protein
MRFSLPALISIACANQSAPALASLRAQQGAYEVQVLVDGSPAPTFHHNGESWVMGHLGERYEIRVANHSDRRVEAVVSVDGRDVIDGKRGSFKKRGYLVEAYGEVRIDGFRLSNDLAAAFRFSSVPRSYAARMGDARDVGVIGVAVFPERVRRPIPMPKPLARRKDHRAGEGGGRAESRAPSAPGPSASMDSSDDPIGGLEEQSRTGLGTEFGEQRDSPVREVAFVRANSSRPAAVLGIRYDDRAGLIAAGVVVEPPDPRREEVRRRRLARPFPTERAFAQPPPGWSDEYR